MGIRETLNKNPAITTGMTIGIIVLAIAFIVYEIMPSRGPRISSKAFYTEDNGATHFAYDASKLPPFTEGGHTDAVRCFVYKCNGHEFVGYMEKFSPEALKALNDNQGRPHAAEMRGMPGRMVKAPKDTRWYDVIEDREDAQQIMTVKCPDGSGGEVIPVTP